MVWKIKYIFYFIKRKNAPALQKNHQLYNLILKFYQLNTIHNWQPWKIRREGNFSKRNFGRVNGNINSSMKILHLFHTPHNTTRRSQPRLTISQHAINHIITQAFGLSSLKAVVVFTSKEPALAIEEACGSSSWSGFRTYPGGAFLSYTPGEYGRGTASAGTYGQNSAFFPVLYLTRCKTSSGSTYPVTVSFCSLRSTSTWITPFIPVTEFLTFVSHPSQSIFTLISTVCTSTRQDNIVKQTF